MVDADKPLLVLYCGKLPDRLLMCGRYVRVSEEDDRAATILARGSLLQLISTLGNDLKTAAIVKGTCAALDQAVSMLTRIVAAIKESCSNMVEELKSMNPEQRMARVRSTRQLLGTAERILHTLRDNIRTAATDMNSDQQASWLRATAAMKYGAKALTLARGAADVATLAGLVAKELTDCVTVDLVARESDMRAHVSKASAVELWAEVQAAPPDARLGVTGLLYAYGCVGLQLDVGRSEAAVVNPWYIVVSLNVTHLHTHRHTHISIYLVSINGLPMNFNNIEL